jgi:Cysteine rich repeat
MHRLFAPMAAAVALCLSATVAGAENYRGTDDAQAACTPDVFRLCSSEIPNETRIVACLKRKKARLSPGCKKVFS